MKYTIAIAGVLLAVGIFLLIYNLKFAEGRRHKLVIIVSSVFGAIAAASVLYAVFADISAKEDKEKYDVHGGMLNTVRYIKTENDLYIFHQSELLSTGSYIAVPKADVQLPALTAVYPYVMIYTPERLERYDAEFSVGKGQVWTNAVKIVPEHIGFAVLTVIFSLLVIFVYNLIVFIRTLVERGKAESGNIK